MLTDQDKKTALAHLNEICPDTFDEGEFGPWTFTNLSRDDESWTLAFDNSEGVDSITFTFDGHCVDASGIVIDHWFEQINGAIQEWEADRSA